MLRAEPLLQSNASNAYLEHEMSPIIQSTMEQVGKIVTEKAQHSAEQAANAQAVYERSSMLMFAASIAGILFGLPVSCSINKVATIVPLAVNRV